MKTRMHLSRLKDTVELSEVMTAHPSSDVVRMSERLLHFRRGLSALLDADDLLDAERLGLSGIPKWETEQEGTSHSAHETRNGDGSDDGLTRTATLPEVPRLSPLTETRNGLNTCETT